jgi:hypothetical protein
MLAPAAILDAAMTIDAVLQRLEPYMADSYVVVRQRIGVGLRWHTFQVADVRQVASLAARRGLPATTTKLDEIVQLRDRAAERTFQIALATRAELAGAAGILLNGDAVLGVLEPTRSASAVTRGDSPRATQSPPYPATEPVGAGQDDERSWLDGASPRSSFRAFPRLDAPETIRIGVPFDLVVGLSEATVTGTAGEPIIVDDAPEDGFDLVVQVIAHEFAAPEGIRRVLHLRRDRPEAAVATITLVAHNIPDEVHVAVVEVEFSHAGIVCGRAWREIRITKRRPTSPRIWPVASGGASLEAPPSTKSPDLTVTITIGELSDELVWLFTTPHPIALPDGKVATRLGPHNAQSFAIKVLREIPAKDGTKLINNTLLGTAREVARAMPVEFWDVLGAVWARVVSEQRVATVLLVSSEPYVPWELASVEEDWVDAQLLDPARPPLLGAQLRVGRWIPPRPRSPRGPQRPLLPPSAQIGISGFAVVVGDYLAETGQRPLPKAIEEGRALVLRYDGLRLAATIDDIDRLLEDHLERDGVPATVQAVHFACHGEVDLLNPAYNGIILSDGHVRLDPTVVTGSQLGRRGRPFVFVNACQLGTAGEVLGDYGGLAGAFLNEGCRAFLAPLWSIDDQIAHDVALQLYRRAVDEGAPVSEVLRELRAQVDLTGDAPPASWLAYVFYGHPDLTLIRGH